MLRSSQNVPLKCSRVATTSRLYLLFLQWLSWNLIQLAESVNTFFICCLTVLFMTANWGIYTFVKTITTIFSRSQWPRQGVDLRKFACWYCGFKSHRGYGNLSLLSDFIGLIACPKESYRVWLVWEWSWSRDNEESLTHWGLLRHGKNNF